MNKIGLIIILLGFAAVPLAGCSDGQKCESHFDTLCVEGINYWIDSCGNFEEVIKKCADGCKADQSGCVGDRVECAAPEDCPAGQGCQLPAGVCGDCRDENDCRSGERCKEGICSLGCNTGPCCEDGEYLGENEQCAFFSEFRCSGTECGADAQRRLVTQYCSGVSSSCDGSLSEGPWEYTVRCGTNAVCWASSDGAGCTDCAVFCKDGVCSECTDEPCCDDGQVAAEGTVCDTWSEYRCSSNECGADAQERTVTRVCNGASVNCTGDKTEGDWSTIQDCDLSDVCWSDDEGAGCTTCNDGCEDGACTEPCEDGPCCDNGSLRDSSYICSSYQEYRCTGTVCGEDAEERTVSQHCTGATSVCNGAIERTDWELVEDCSEDALCWADENGAGCNVCELGCSGESCTPCSDEPCCDNGELRQSGFQCDAWTEYRCNGADCGSDAQQRQVRQYCSGTSAYCNGAIVEDGWEICDPCHGDDICITDETTFAECQNCPNGCTDGQCIE